MKPPPLILLSLALPLAWLSAEPLFNGRDLDGWVIESGGDFSVRDGKIHVNRGTGWLRSEEQFADFTLVLEFRFLEEDANSGIFVRTRAASKDDENGWPADGYQVQCRDTTEGETPLGMMINYGGPETEDHPDLEALLAAYRPTGEWNLFVISCEGEHLTVQLNGRVVSSSTGLKNSPAHIGIQAEDGLLEFRQVEVLRH